MSYTVNFSIFPLDEGAHVGDMVAKVVDRIDSSGLAYKVTAMGTLIEGESDQVLDVVRDCQKILEGASQRFYTVITMDYRAGASGGLDSKVDSVEKHLGRSVQR